MTNDNVILFRSKNYLDASKNLKEFINFCKNDLVMLDSNIEWEYNEWKGIAIFCKMHEKIYSSNNDSKWLDSEFVEFAKAYVKYQYMQSPSKGIREASIAVLRVLERALLQVNKNADVTQINTIVLDECANIIMQSYSGSPAYNYGRKLQILVEFLGEKGMLKNGRLFWTTPLKGPELASRVSKEAEKARLGKLPNETSLNAIAEIFSLPDEELTERDKFTTSVFSLLMCAPSRISEILALPYDCEVTEKDSKGVERYGLRFYSHKGYGADVKWIPEPMVPVAKKAIARLKKLSHQARSFAKWAEENPDSFYQHDAMPDIHHDKILEPAQIASVLGFCPSAKKTLSRLDFYDGQKTYTINSLWKIILKKLPVNFPWFDKKKGIKYSNALCLLSRHQLDKRKFTIFYELQWKLKGFVMGDVFPSEHANRSFENIFSRHGYVGTDGIPLHLKTHQPRHLLNTIAQRNGMSNLDIAKWSGRAKVSQNKVYNHVSEDEMLRKAEELDISSIGSQAFMIDSVEPNLPVTPGMLNLWEHGAIHVTEYGYCVHDYMMSPCEKFRDCINCNEQVCEKGEEDKLQRLKERLNMTERLLSKAKESMTEEELGADRWVKHHESTLSRLRELISILSDDAIPDGSRIKLGGESFTQLGRVLNKFENIENKGNTNYIN
ncbi:integrase [Salmonella enterica]|nr:integrase [Salmonella enterica subsp. enterica serovar Brunei]EIR6863965.1 integrase [Salmonella enterica]